MHSRLHFLLAAAAGVFFAADCSGPAEIPSTVVVYSSVDEVFARPVAAQFQEETGIEVLLVPDTEETKSTGLLNRLIAERQRPQADVFWSGDPVRAAMLKSLEITESYYSPMAADLPSDYSDAGGHWTGFSARARVLIYNTNLVEESEKPRSVMDLLDARFQGQASIANPLFGTTTVHAAALFEVLGEAEARQFFEGFIQNGGTIVSSNGEVRRRVAAGDFAVGITDTDDFNVAYQEGRPIGIVFPDQEGMGTLIIPNAVVLIRRGPNPQAGRQFIDYLLRPDTERALAESEAAQIPLRPDIGVPPYVRPLQDINTMRVDYQSLAEGLDSLSTGFIRTWVERNVP
jgi:iron(III) transport system substrate-binding protein